MLPFQSYSRFESWLGRQSNGLCVLQEPRSSTFLSTQMNDGISTLSSSSAVETKKPTETCKSHKEAERRRRQRINTHLSTLRSILPKAAKADKASLLAEVVQHVRELRRQVADVAQLHGWDVSSSPATSSGCRSGHAETDGWPFPGESDEVTLSRYEDGEVKLLKATVCCEDRDNLNRELSRAIQSVRAKVLKVKMVTIGGRTKNVVVLQWPKNCGEEEVGALKRALNAVIDNRASFGPSVGQVIIGNKRVSDPYGLVNKIDDDDTDRCFTNNGSFSTDLTIGGESVGESILPSFEPENNNSSLHVEYDDKLNDDVAIRELVPNSVKEAPIVDFNSHAVQESGCFYSMQNMEKGQSDKLLEETMNRPGTPTANGNGEEPNVVPPISKNDYISIQDICDESSMFVYSFISRLLEEFAEREGLHLKHNVSSYLRGQSSDAHVQAGNAGRPSYFITEGFRLTSCPSN